MISREFLRLAGVIRRRHATFDRTESPSRVWFGRSNDPVSPPSDITQHSADPGNRDRAAETVHPSTFPHGNSALTASPGMTRRGVSHALGGRSAGYEQRILRQDGEPVVHPFGIGDVLPVREEPRGI